ncbi:hypothetical protein L1887_09850 [Cichorium endivia]|nr:hypothetical protein L1887_09850 [Cichorium endivia]
MITNTNNPHHRRRQSSAGLLVDKVLKNKTGNLKDDYAVGLKLGHGQFGYYEDGYEVYLVMELCGGIFLFANRVHETGCFKRQKANQNQEIGNKRRSIKCSLKL